LTCKMILKSYASEKMRSPINQLERGTAASFPWNDIGLMEFSRHLN
jgi:hypothetical protein